MRVITLTGMEIETAGDVTVRETKNPLWRHKSVLREEKMVTAEDRSKIAKETTVRRGKVVAAGTAVIPVTAVGRSQGQQGHDHRAEQPAIRTADVITQMRTLRAADRKAAKKRRA